MRRSASAHAHVKMQASAKGCCVERYACVCKLLCGCFLAMKLGFAAAGVPGATDIDMQQWGHRKPAIMCATAAAVALAFVVEGEAAGAVQTVVAK
jgi:hypothetical protein